MNITKNFTKAELACRCGCGFLPKPEASAKLQELRDRCGFPLKITSAARCESHNAKVGGAAKSKHVEGIAFDIARPNSYQMGFLLAAAVELGFKGIGWHKSFVHLDLRPDFMAWDY